MMKMRYQEIKALLSDPNHLKALDKVLVLQGTAGFTMYIDDLGLDVVEIVDRVFDDLYDDLCNRPDAGDVELNALERLKRQVVKEQRPDLAEWLRNHEVAIDY